MNVNLLNVGDKVKFTGFIKDDPLYIAKYKDNLTKGKWYVVIGKSTSFKGSPSFFIDDDEEIRQNFTQCYVNEYIGFETLTSERRKKLKLLK